MLPNQCYLRRNAEASGKKSDVMSIAIADSTVLSLNADDTEVCRFMSCRHVMSSCHAIVMSSCHVVMSCHCHVVSCHVKSCHANVMSFHVMPMSCRVMSSRAAAHPVNDTFLIPSLTLISTPSNNPPPPPHHHHPYPPSPPLPSLTTPSLTPPLYHHLYPTTPPLSPHPSPSLTTPPSITIFAPVAGSCESHVRYGPIHDDGSRFEANNQPTRYVHPPLITPPPSLLHPPPYYTPPPTL